MEDKKWYRVDDPLNPLYGCDVMGYVEAVGPQIDQYLAVTAMRRVDVFIGDRPFQLNAPDGATLGVLVNVEHLTESPIQGDIQIGHDRPYGVCLDESEMTRPDRCTLRVVRYEKAQQVALDDASGSLLGSRTYGTADGADSPGLRNLINMFRDDGAVEDIVYELKQRD